MKRWNVLRQFWVVLAVLLLASIWVGPALALNIVDTGTPTGELNGVLGGVLISNLPGSLPSTSLGWLPK